MEMITKNDMCHSAANEAIASDVNASDALKMLAQMPDDIQRMALGFAYGLKASETTMLSARGA